MRNLKRKLISQSTILLLIGWGIIGSIMFFPVNFSGKHTCLSDRLFNYLSGNLEDNSFHKSEEKYSKNDVHHRLSGDLLLQNYVLPFGICWWLFLGILGTGMYLYKTRYNKLKLE